MLATHTPLYVLQRELNSHYSYNYERDLCHTAEKQSRDEGSGSLHCLQGFASLMDFPLLLPQSP